MYHAHTAAAAAIAIAVVAPAQAQSDEIERGPREDWAVPSEPLAVPDDM